MTGIPGKQGRASAFLPWLIIAVYAVATPVPSFFRARLSDGAQLAFVVFLPLVLPSSTARRYGIAGIAVFLVLCFVVSNAFESLGVLTAIHEKGGDRQPVHHAVRRRHLPADPRASRRRRTAQKVSQSCRTRRLCVISGKNGLARHRAKP